MRTLYIADDGKQFEDECECISYEFCISHLNLKTIELYNNDDEKLTNPLDEDTYFNLTKIVVHSGEELMDLHKAANYTGFIGYYDIKDVGTWIFDKNKKKFIKYVNPAFNKELSDKYVGELNKYNTETDHEDADYTLLELLSDLGYMDVVETYIKIPKWYS